jgi:hypothetical protein
MPLLHRKGLEGLAMMTSQVHYLSQEDEFSPLWRGYGSPFLISPRS